jgi:hypothetical protein
MTALIVAAALVTACGNSGDDKTERTAKGAATSSPKPATEGGDRTYAVTLEVGGKGKTNVYYNLETNHFEQVTLPWKKSAEITLNSTERKVGALVSVVPGPVILDNGRAAAAPCSITVDGKSVVDDPGGTEGKHSCKYTLR